MKFWKNLPLKFLLLSLCLLTSFACSTSKKEDEVNQVFQQKYGKEVEKIRSQRAIPADGAMMYYAPNRSDLDNSDYAANQGYYPYVDVAKFGEKTPQRYMPNGESYEQDRSKNPSNSLPPNMFEISYNTELSPPFRRVGAEFDTITIPPADVYGVKTEMSEKSYTLAGNSSLQKNIDQIISTKTEDDVEISQILIREQKQLKRRQKMIKTFGQDAIELASLEGVSGDRSEKKAKVKSEKASLKKDPTNNPSDSNGAISGQNIPQPNLITKAVKN